MNILIAFFSLSVTLTSAQFFYNQPAAFPLVYQHQVAQPAAPRYPRGEYAHPSLIENAMRESQLPPELSKSDRFYSNPHIAAALAKESWFTDKEMPVIDREAEKIPREMVYKIFKNAGWIKRR